MVQSLSASTANLCDDALALARRLERVLDELARGADVDRYGVRVACGIAGTLSDQIRALGTHDLVAAPRPPRTLHAPRAGEERSHGQRRRAGDSPSAQVYDHSRPFKAHP